MTDQAGWKKTLNISHVEGFDPSLIIFATSCNPNQLVPHIIKNRKKNKFSTIYIYIYITHMNQFILVHIENIK